MDLTFGGGHCLFGPMLTLLSDPLQKPAAFPAVWLIDLASAASDALPEAEPEDRARADGRPFAQRDSVLLRRRLMRQIVATAADGHVRFSSEGIPRIEGGTGGLYLSTSHRAPWQVVAMGQVPLGVDVEPRHTGPHDTGTDSIPWNVLHPDEADALRQMDDPARMPAFLRLWTAKEAWLKVIAAGLAREPSTFAVTGFSGTGCLGTVRDPRSVSAGRVVWAQTRDVVIAMATRG